MACFFAWCLSAIHSSSQSRFDAGTMLHHPGRSSAAAWRPSQRLSLIQSDMRRDAHTARLELCAFAAKVLLIAVQEQQRLAWDQRSQSN